MLVCICLFLILKLHHATNINSKNPTSIQMNYKHLSAYQKLVLYFPLYNIKGCHRKPGTVSQNYLICMKER